MLAGCSAIPGPVRTVTASPSPAVTVTANPAPDSADTPLTALTAWTACAAFLSTYGQPNGVAVTPNSFGPSTVTADGTGFRVQWAGSNPKEYVCSVGGTLGDPKITDWVTAQ